MLHVHTQASVIPEDPKTFSEVSTAVRAGLPGVLELRWSSAKLLRTLTPTGWLWAGKEQPVSQKMELSGTKLQETLYVSVEMPVLKQPAWQEWHFPMSDSYGNWASKPYPLLNHIWILPTAPELIPNNNTFTLQMHIPLTESLVTAFH